MSFTLTPRQRVVLAADYLSRRDAGRQGYLIEYAPTGELLLYRWYSVSGGKLKDLNPFFIQPDGTVLTKDREAIDELTATAQQLERLLAEEQAVVPTPA